jgi:hypothetical protein
MRKIQAPFTLAIVYTGNDKGKFTDITKQAGLINHAFALSAAIYDFNNDSWPDIYVANDFNKPDFIYINNHNGTFTEKLSDYFNHVSFHPWALI